MKKRDKYFLVLMFFLMAMLLVFLYFYKKYNNTNLINETKLLLGDLYNLESGKYELKNGILYDENNNIVNNKEYVKASGYIYIDKYMNVSFKLNKDDGCISKTSLGKINYEYNYCSEIKEVNVHIIKNNNNISFETDEELEYMISNKDDFNGFWVKQDYSSNIIINSYNEGKNYIWFKDMYGNLSKTYSFKVDCLDTKNAKYNDSVFYCSGSTVILDDIKWVVIRDNNSSIELMKYLPLDKKMEFSDDINDIRWSKSKINNYLNNEYIHELSSETINKLLTIEICDDYDSINCNEEVCGGRSKNEIERLNYYCSSYTGSKIKLISYDEFNYAYSKAKNKDFLYGNYWSINSLELGVGTSIQYNYDYYILEKFNNKLDVRPVIIIDK